MIDVLLVDLLPFLVTILFLGVPENNLLCPGQVRRLNTNLLQMPLLSLFRLKLLFVNLVFHSRKNHVYGVIILAPPSCLLIQSFMLVLNILR
jgi:hypothetical protein